MLRRNVDRVIDPPGMQQEIHGGSGGQASVGFLIVFGGQFASKVVDRRAEHPGPRAAG